MAQEFGNQEKSYLSGLLRSALNSFKAFAYEDIAVDNTEKHLTVPADAKYALMKLVSDGTGNVANYLEFIGTVSSSKGIPISDGTVFDVTDYANLKGFSIQEITSNSTTLYVQYYK